MGGKITLRPVDLTDEYSKKWNNISNDFVHIYKDDVKVSDTLYREGVGCGEIDDEYFLMIRYTESFYDDDIATDKDAKRNLKGQWCIINSVGEETIVFKQFKIPYLLGGIIYSVDNSYYNIKTNEMYCKSASRVLNSREYLFIDDYFNVDRNKRGIMQINKFDGSVIIHQR